MGMWTSKTKFENKVSSSSEEDQSILIVELSCQQPVLSRTNTTQQNRFFLELTLPNRTGSF